MKYIKKRSQFVIESVDTKLSDKELVDDVIKNNKRDGVTNLINHLLSKGNIMEAKRLITDLNEYTVDNYIRYSDIVGSLEFLDYVFELKPKLFLTAKSRWFGGLDIGNARNGFNLIKQGSNNTQKIIDDLFENNFNKGLIELAVFCIENDLLEVLNQVVKRFGKDNDLTVLQKGDAKTTKYKMILVSEIARHLHKNNKVDFESLIGNNPHLIEGLTKANKLTIIRDTPSESKDVVMGTLHGKMTPNDYWRIHIRNPEWMKVEDLRKYVRVVKSTPKLSGIKNILKVKQKLLDKEFIEMFKEEGILKDLGPLIGHLYMHSLKFVGMFNRNKESAIELLDLLIDNSSVDKEYLASELSYNFSDLNDMDEVDYDDDGKTSGFDRMIRHAFTDKLYTGGKSMIDVGEEGAKEVHNLFKYLLDVDSSYEARARLQQLNKEIKDMDQTELNVMMDRALDKRDFEMAREIGKYLKH